MANSVTHAALPYPIKNARFSLEVPFLDADGDPTDPTTPDTEFSLDNATFADCAEEVTTTAGTNGIGYITLSGAETNGSMVALAFKVASGPKATLATLYPRVLASVGTGTLSAGSAGGGTLGTPLAYDVTGCFVQTTGGTGGGGTGGANNQARKIVTYNTSTGAFTVSPNWETTPDATTTYSVLLPEGVTLGMLKTLNPATAGRTVVVDASGLVDANTVKLGPTGAGTAQTARDIGTSVLLSSGTGTGQLKLASGYVAPTLADIAVPSANSAYALGVLWYGTLSSVAATTVTLPGGHGLDVEGNYAIVLVSGTNAAGKSRFLTFSTGATWTVDPAWTSDSETTPSGTVVAYIIAAPKIPTSAIPTVKVSVGTGTGQINIASGKVPATIAAGDIAASAITATSIASDAITAAKIADGAIDAATFASGAINAAAIATDAITAAKIAADAIGASELAADAVTEIQSGLSTLTATTVRSALGLASANLDTQLDALPTNAELATALGTADDAVLAAIAALNNLSSAGAQAAAAAALSAYTAATTANVTAVPAAVLAAATAAPIAANVEKVNDVALQGAGVSGNKWRPV